MKRGARALAFALLLGGPAAAHTAVTGVQPGAHAVISRPEAVVLTFSEPVALRFATFAVYPLPAGDRASLNRAAARLLKAPPESATRADTWASGSGATGTRPTGSARRVAVPLKPALAPGAYAVVWRVLSGDGHVVSGQSVFTVR